MSNEWERKSTVTASAVSVCVHPFVIHPKKIVFYSVTQPNEEELDETGYQARYEVRCVIPSTALAMLKAKTLRSLTNFTT